uniref:DNA-binding WRKY n=1 Tax=Tanacetum cinerariifolium TaxID=118510 RepID=A0A6L2J930_TANCI|nr:DNA-binding WRKY [Tanacetum cinerariifolium]
MSLEVGSIRRIQGIGYGVLEFLGVGTTLDIFQNIILLYFQYGVLVFTGYGVLEFLGVGTTLDIFQNIILLYFQYGVLVFTGYGVLFSPNKKIARYSPEHSPPVGYLKEAGRAVQAAGRGVIHQLEVVPSSQNVANIAILLSNDMRSAVNNDVSSVSKLQVHLIL